MKGFLGKVLREWRRQTVPPATPSRVSGINSAALPTTVIEPTTRRNEEGRGLNLFIPDVDPLDDERFFLGDDPIEPSEL